MLHLDRSRRKSASRVAVNIVSDRVQSRRFASAHMIPASIYRRGLVRRIRVDQQEIDEVHFKLANTLGQREQAFRLVHHSYVERGIATPTRSGLVFSPFHILPGTTTFIAEKEGAVIGTVSLIEDSPIGIPMEAVHPAEIAAMRYNGRRFAEVGTLSVASGIRGRGIPLMLYNTLFRWARRHRMIEDLVIAVHPKVRKFYCDGLLFERLGPDRQYHSLNGALSTPLHIDLTTGASRYRDFYDKGGMEIAIGDRRTNLYRFFVEDVVENIKLPHRPCFPFDLSCPPVWTEHDVAAYMLACRAEVNQQSRQIQKTFQTLYPGLAEQSFHQEPSDK